MSTRRSVLLVGPFILLLAACSAGAGPAGSPGSSGEPNQSGSPGQSDNPEPSLPPSTIDHPSGATDVILRFEEGGGFVPLGYLVTQAPAFSLFGDGTVIYRNQFAEPIPPGPIVRDVPFKTARLSEDEVQELLGFAINDGGLGVARDSYENQMVADAPTTTFTLNAGGLEKTVSIYALGIEGPDQPDAAPRAAFARLAERLREFEASDEAVYEPERFRGVLYDAFGDGAAQDWPWPDITPADFVAENDPDVPASGFPSRVMTRAEVEALGMDDFDGGFQGVVLEASDGEAFSFGLRPLLPDDEA